MNQYVEIVEPKINKAQAPLPEKANVVVEVGQTNKETREKQKKAKLVSEINKIRPIHKNKGICYTTTVTALSAYRNAKFSTLDVKRDKFASQLEARDVEVGEANPFIDVFEKLCLLEQNNKNRTDNIEANLLKTASLIQRIDIALKIAFDCDSRIYPDEILKERRCQKKILEERYLLLRTALLTKEERIANSGVKKSEYYRRLEDAIEQVSIALWGPMGEKHPGLNQLLNQMAKAGK
jgi:hypothetical protein